MLRLVDPTNVADAASAGEGTCVERISPMEGEELEPPRSPIKATTVLAITRLLTLIIQEVKSTQISYGNDFKFCSAKSEKFKEMWR